MKLQNLIVKLRKWIQILETKVKTLPKWVPPCWCMLRITETVSCRSVEQSSVICTDILIFDLMVLYWETISLKEITSSYRHMNLGEKQVGPRVGLSCACNVMVTEILVWRLLSFGMWFPVILYVITNVLEDYTASIFRVE
jgi:hypothetical protein